MNDLHTKTRFSFTLVEISVVIAIIALVAAFSIPMFNVARRNYRDVKRMADLKTIQNALAMYYATYGHYPIISQWATSESTDWDSGTKWAQLQTELSPYLNPLPHDPLGTGSSLPWYTGHYHYIYGASSDGLVYDLACQIEGTGNENTCQYKCYHWHQGDTYRGGGNPPETPWCNVCPGGAGGSKYMYADH